MADQARDVPSSPDLGQYKSRNRSALRHRCLGSAFAPTMDTSRHLLRRLFQMHERFLKILHAMQAGIVDSFFNLEQL